jgi:hypothetical protein
MAAEAAEVFVEFPQLRQPSYLSPVLLLKNSSTTFLHPTTINLLCIKFAANSNSTK